MIYQYKETEKTFGVIRLKKYMKLYLGHVDFKLPVESPIRNVLCAIKYVSQKPSRVMKDNNVATIADVKDKDQEKQEENTDQIQTRKKASTFNSETTNIDDTGIGNQKRKEVRKSSKENVNQKSIGQ